MGTIPLKHCYSNLFCSDDHCLLHRKFCGLPTFEGPQNFVDKTCLTDPRLHNIVQKIQNLDIKMTEFPPPTNCGTVFTILSKSITMETSTVISLYYCMHTCLQMCVSMCLNCCQKTNGQSAWNILMTTVCASSSPQFTSHIW